MPFDKIDAQGNLTLYGATDPTLLQNPNFVRWFGKSKVRGARGEPLVVYHGTPNGGFSRFKKGRYGIFFTSNRQMSLGYTPKNADHPLPIHFNSIREALRDMDEEEYAGRYHIAEFWYDRAERWETDPEWFESEEDLRAAYDGPIEDWRVAKVYELKTNGIPQGKYYVEKPDPADLDTTEWENYAPPLDETAEMLDAISEAPVQTGPAVYECVLRMEHPWIVDGQGANWNDLDIEWEDENGKRIKVTTNELATEAEEADFDGLIILNIADNGGYSTSFETGTVFIIFKPDQIKSVYNRGTFATEWPDAEEIERLPIYERLPAASMTPDTSQEKIIGLFRQFVDIPLPEGTDAPDYVWTAQEGPSSSAGTARGCRLRSSPPARPVWPVGIAPTSKAGRRR